MFTAKHGGPATARTGTGEAGLMLATCTGAQAEAAPLARTETGARAVCCRPARGEQTVLVARIGRDLPCARASKRAFAPLCVAATRIPARKLLRGRQRYTRSRAAGRRRCVLKNRRPSLVIASGRGGRPHCARQLPSKSLRPRPGTRDCSARDCVERWQWHKQCRQW